MPSSFDQIYAAAVVPTLMGLHVDRDATGQVRLWKYHSQWPAVEEPRRVAVHAGNVETRVEETFEREKRISERLILLTRDPDDEVYPGLAHVHKSGVFESPDGDFWSVVDDETDSRSPNFHRLRCQRAQWRKTDGYAQR